MFCSNCGSELEENANFCANCGTPVPGATGMWQPEDAVDDAVDEGTLGNSVGESVNGEKTREMSSQKKKLGDGAIDFVSSKLSGGKKIETIRISMEDMLALLKEHYVVPATTKEELKKLQKAVNGGVIGVTHLTSNDGNYNLSVSVAMQLGGRLDLLHPGDSNWIRVLENNTGKVYQYSSLTWGKFKKAVKAMIEEAK